MGKGNGILPLKEWLAKYGQESCGGCKYNNAARAHCSYSGGHCFRYDSYVADCKRNVLEQLELF